MWLTIRAVQRAVRQDPLHADVLVRTHLGRIARSDAHLHAFIYVDQGAAAAKTGPLSGCTVAVKDTQPVRGMPWTWGSPRWRQQVATLDTLPVERLRNAGGAIVGKTNLPELAASLDTTNELFPPTENPWKRGLSPGGSSGGSAVAAAAGLATIATGDDSAGSIRIPAACCGVVGLRPSPGLVPLDVVDPSSLVVRGPIARTVKDVRIALSIMSGSATSSARQGNRTSSWLSRSPSESTSKQELHDGAIARPADHAVGSVLPPGVQVLLKEFTATCSRDSRQRRR